MKNFGPILIQIAVAGWLAFGCPVYGQIATPSLDPTLKSDMPAAASWRFSSTIAGAVTVGTGEYTNSAGETTDELTRTAAEALIAHQFEDITVEYHRNLKFKEVKKDSSSDQEATTETTHERINLAYRMDETVSLGATYRTWENAGDRTNGVGRSWETGDGKEVGMGIGGSFRLGDMIFLAASMENVTHSKSDYEDNTWTDTYLGVGILGEGVFRLEYSKIISPESTTEQSQMDHPASDDVRIGVEVKLDNWLILCESRKYVVKPIGGGEDAEYEYTTVGLGFVPETGMVISLSGTQGKKDDWYSITDIRLALGLNY
ncbi:MAG: hypothetical protein GY866_31645 [Proteobacteria bacterium]|nr:hypothetical protein [Pseudomonadota bacterium]